MAQLRELTWPEAKRWLRKGPVLVPTGSTEQHGHHMPLGTDHMIAERLAHAVGEKLGLGVAPTLPYGISSEHRQFPGTMWVSFESFCAYLGDVCRSLAHHGARKIILVNGHGGQQFAVQYLARQLRDEKIHLGIYEWWEGITDDFDDKVYGKAGRHWGHGCVKETAMGLAIFPHAVKMRKAKDVATNWGPRLKGGVTALDAVDFSPVGNIGHPTHADAKMARATFDLAVRNLTDYVRHLQKASLKKLLSYKIKE